MRIRALTATVVMLAAVTGCSRDPNIIKRKHLEAGNRYFERGQYKQAIILYRNALSRDARYGEAYYRLALIALKTNQPGAAVGNLRRAIELLPAGQKERTDARIKLAEIYLNDAEVARQRPAELIREVEETIQELLKADPRSFDGHRLQARLVLTQAQAVFQSRSPDIARAELEKAIRAFRTANLPQEEPPRRCHRNLPGLCEKGAQAPHLPLPSGQGAVPERGQDAGQRGTQSRPGEPAHQGRGRRHQGPAGTHRMSGARPLMNYSCTM